MPVTPSCREKLAKGRRVGGGQVRSSSPAGGEEQLRANSARAEWALAALAGASLLPPGLPTAAAERAALPGLSCTRSSGSCAAPPPPLLREDESGLHISTSELKGETEEGGGGQACLRLETFKSLLKPAKQLTARTSQSMRLGGGNVCLPPTPRLSFYPLPNLKKKNLRRI